MKRIIINADDLGADSARNRGIIEAVSAGGVTSVSILANGPALDDAIAHIRPLGPGKVSPGVHFNISEGRPLASGLKTIIGPDGNFLGKAATLSLLADDKNSALEDDIARELNAQIETLLSAGLRLTHIDGHQHVHVFPAAIKAVCAAALRYGVPWIRVPDEPETAAGEDCPAGLVEEARRFSMAARSARPVIIRSGIMTTDHFRGLTMKGRLTLGMLRKVIDRLPQGLTEIMVHPGRRLSAADKAGPFSSFSTIDRENELNVFLSDKFHRILSAMGVILIPFPEVKD